tara:strand:- start:8 stop:877 length:870 start_codon:yes stop_codon:yes gene_type:complete
MATANYVRQMMKPLSPVDTGVVPVLSEIDGIKAVVFDIYGTLMISAAGDISLSDQSTSMAGMEAVRAIEAATFGSIESTRLLDLYQETISRHQEERRGCGIAHPEVEIREVWSEMVGVLGVSEFGNERIERVALVYECAVNPVWLMPGVTDALAAIKSAGLKMGIISNAQFYTVPVFESLLDLSLLDSGFDSELMVFSYQCGEGKPSLRPYENSLDQTRRKGIAPSEVFYLGNDLFKDVIPASAVGFRTGLFAGDQRSLRTGDLDIETASRKADVVLSELSQLPGVLGI